MSDRLPRVLRRQKARSIHEREAALLDSAALMRDVETAILGEPDADTYIMAAEDMGLRVTFLDDAGAVYGLYKDDRIVGVVIDPSDGTAPMLLPVE